MTDFPQIRQRIHPVVLICGSREYQHESTVKGFIRSLPSTALVIEGGAKGVDSLARKFATERKIHVATVPALWSQFHKAAGPKRNAAMLQLKPHAVVAFPVEGSKGTADMINRAKLAGVETIVIAPSGKVIAHYNEKD